MVKPLPTLAGFQTFVTDIMQIPEAALPSGSPVIGYAFETACAIVLKQIQGISPFLYEVAVYNLAASILIQYAPDQPGQTYFADYRKAHGIGIFTPGIIQSSSDSGTAQSWMIPEALKNLSLADLQNLKNPYGLAYLQIAQSYGAIWGLT